MAAKYMMDKKSSGHKDIDYFYDEDSPYGFKLAQAWDIGDGVYLGFTDYRYIIDSTTHNHCVKWSYGTKSITYIDHSKDIYMRDITIHICVLVQRTT